MKWFNALSRIFSSRPAPQQAPLSKAKLVGYYLSDTNSREGYSTDFQQTRERRNGKYSHSRERA